MNNDWWRPWLLNLMRSWNSHVLQEEITCGYFLGNITSTRTEALFRPTDVILQQGCTLLDMLRYKKPVCPTPSTGLCLLSPKRSVSICPFPFLLRCSHHGSARHETQGWLTAVCWFNATAYFLCLFVLMSAFSGVSGWVSAPLFPGPSLSSALAPQRSWSFLQRVSSVPACSNQTFL